MAQEHKIKMPFVFMNPFDQPEVYVVVVWINAFRTRQHKPVMVDWTAKALLNFATKEQIENFYRYNFAYHGSINALKPGPDWSVRVAQAAPTEVDGAMAVRHGIKPLRRLRGVFRSNNRKIPGWALDAFPAHVVLHYETTSKNYYGDSKSLLFCLPDSSDKVFVEVVRALQDKTARLANTEMKRRDIGLPVPERREILFCVNPKLSHKKKLIESLGEKPWFIDNKKTPRLFLVEPEFKEAS